MPVRPMPLALVALISLSACSPYVYTQEINGFATGVTAVAASYQTGRQAIDTASVEQRDAAFVMARTRLMLLAGCDQIAPMGTPPKLPDCGIVTFGADAAPPANAVQKALGGAAPAFDALKTYAAALAAVTAAADGTALNQASQSLTTAAGGLAAAIAKAAPQAATGSKLVTPAAGLLGQGITLYLDQRRYAVLSNTVPGADPAVQYLGQVVSTALLVIWKQQLLLLGMAMRGAAEPLEQASATTLGASDYQAKLGALEVKLAAFTQARAADPTATANAMVAAHHQLAQALAANAGEDKAVLATGQAFVASAGQLETAIDAASTAAKAPAPAKN